MRALREYPIRASSKRKSLEACWQVPRRAAKLVPRYGLRMNVNVNAEMHAVKTAAPFLILAHHRSGSNFLNDLVQARPDVDCINEPFSMHTPFFRECDLEHWSGADFDPRWLHRSLVPHAQLRCFLRELRRHLGESHAQRIVGFKETGLFGKLGWLKAFLPGLRVLWVQRDPRAIVSSVLRSGLMDFWRYRELVPPRFEALCPGYRRAPAGTRAHDAELVAMSVVVRLDMAQRSLGPFAHHTVRLDDFALDPRAGLQQLCRFLGLEAHPEQLAFLRQRQGITRGGRYSSFRSHHDVQDAWRRHLTEAQVAAVEAVLQACAGPRFDARQAGCAA